MSKRHGLMTGSRGDSNRIIEDLNARKAKIALACFREANRQRMSFQRINPRLEFELGRGGGGSTEDAAGPDIRTRYQQSPVGLYRCFHCCFSPQRDSAPGHSFGRTGRGRKPGDETDLNGQRNHFTESTKPSRNRPGVHL
jgi:hypothetical protein